MSVGKHVEVRDNAVQSVICLYIGPDSSQASTVSTSRASLPHILKQSYYSGAVRASHKCQLGRQGCC